LDGVLLLEECLALDVAAEDVIEDAAVVGFSLLLNLEDVDVVGELFDLLAGDGIDEGGLTDSVTPDQPVLAALNQLQLSLVQQGFPANNQGKVVDEDVGLEGVGFVVDDGGRGDALFMLHELFDLLVECVLLPHLLLGLLLGAEGVFLLGVVVALGLLGV
jgi:hypothetical protein